VRLLGGSLNKYSFIRRLKMRKIAYICIVGGFVLMLPALNALAQEEQRLGYHSARQVSLTGFSSNLKQLTLTTTKPAGVALPQFKSARPLFARWYSPMAKDGFLWIAMDGTATNGIYNSLYIDSNGNGRLDDETVSAAYRSTATYTYFGPVKVGFQVGDEPVYYHLNFQFSGSITSSRTLSVSSGGWYEGDITINGVKKNCLLFDYNANGAFNDKSLDPAESDRIRIGQASAQNTRAVGKYIDVDGKLYEAVIARDGASIKLSEAKDVKYGKIRLPESVTLLSAGGENGQVILKSASGISLLPVGGYRTTEWAAERKDDKGVPWKLQGNYLTGTSSASGKKRYFEVTDGNEITLSIGEPVLSNLTSTLRSGTYSFSQTLKGRNDERITMTRSGVRPPAPKLNIKNADGTYNRTFSFSYG
jgi:hypothetical protein